MSRGIRRRFPWFDWGTALVTKAKARERKLRHADGRVVHFQRGGLTGAQLIDALDQLFGIGA